VGWLWRDPTCRFIGRDRILRGDLEWAEARPWAGAGADFTPGIGDGKGFIEAFTGRDLVTGEELGAWRWAGLVFLSELRHLRHLDTVGRAARQGAHLGDAGRVARQSRKQVTAFSRMRTASVDFLAQTGRLGGILYGERRLAKLKNYLDRQGVDLLVGDEYLLPGQAGGFQIYTDPDRRPTLRLRSNPTRYEVWHELSHYIHYKRIEREAFINLPRSRAWNAAEQFVYDMLKIMSTVGGINSMKQNEWMRMSILFEVGGFDDGRASYRHSGYVYPRTNGS